MPELIATLGDQPVARLTFPPRATRIIIGRAPESDLVLPSDDVSRTHAIITREDEDLILSDPGSRNGIAINGALLQSPRYLFDRDQLTIGPYTVTLSLASP
ncbi:MAG TPA: FHA domain-containing protein [Kiritimatiellia bacterium]|nr:FHA domain-containing protein [Kiritimatiellia bacterium]